MERSISVFAIVSFLFISMISVAQPMDFLEFTKGPANYRHDAVILLDGKALTKDYFDESKPTLRMGLAGVLSLGLTSTRDRKHTEPIKFHVAIKNQRTNTMWIYPSDELIEVDLRDIWKKCEAGDRLILMPVDQKYSLSTHELPVMSGC